MHPYPPRKIAFKIARQRSIGRAQELSGRSQWPIGTGLGKDVGISPYPSNPCPRQEGWRKTERAVVPPPERSCPHSTLTISNPRRLGLPAEEMESVARETWLGSPGFSRRHIQMTPSRSRPNASPTSRIANGVSTSAVDLRWKPPGGVEVFRDKASSRFR